MRFPGFFSHVEVYTSSCSSPSRSPSFNNPQRSEPDPIYAFRRTNHHWPRSHERIICILKRFYDINDSETQQIFNQYFITELPLGVITQGISAQAIVARWNKISREEENPSFNEVFIETNFSDIQKFWAIHRALEQTAAKVGVELIVKTWEDKQKVLERPEPHKPTKRKRCTSIDNHGVLGAGVLRRTEETDDDERPRTPKRRAINTNPKTLTPKANRREKYGLMTPPSSGVSHQGKRLFYDPLPPRLGFRFFCTKCSFGLNNHRTHGFRAGLYQDVEEFPVTPPPIDPKSIEYRQSVQRHISREITTATPLISVTQNFWGALNRGLLHDDCESFIAIIDLHHASQGDAKYPRRYCSASSIIKAYNIKIDGKGYVGSKEWFLWGEIARSSIISIVSIHDLVNSFAGMVDGEDKDPFRFSVLQSTKSSGDARKELVRQNYRPTLSDFYGESLGKLLSRLVPRSYVGHAAEVILRDWRFPSNWRENHKFIGAIYRGYYTNRDTIEKQQDFVDCLIQQTTKTPISSFEGYINHHSEPTSPSVGKVIRRGVQQAAALRAARNQTLRADLSAVDVHDEDEDEFMAKRRRIEALGA